ncbi:MAG: ribosomal-processing cysteine protease Prp [Clostridia bacterium]|nr:ribosomal-processing cysteine protease Prp [Clostridia bacterium]
MICAEFFKSNQGYSGFRISGHSGYSEAGSDIVCAAVSSATNMTVNLVSEIFGMESDFEIMGEGNLSFSIKNPCENSNKVIEAFKMQLEIIFDEYPDFIKVSVTEV